MEALRYPTADIVAVSELVFLHLRFHTYKMGWSDSAVRRYVRDAGPLLTELNVLTRCDCTTRDERKAARLATRMDELEARIAELAAAEELAAIRPELDGHQVMEHLGVGPGPLVGEALQLPPRCPVGRRARSAPPPRSTASTPGTPSASPDVRSPATQAVGSRSFAGAHSLASVTRTGRGTTR